MFFKQIKNLLPKKLADGVALKTQVLKIQLLRSGGFKKLLNKSVKFSKFSKITLGGLLLLYFSGYQPTPAIPPIKQSVARAEFSQEQTIDSSHLSQPFILPHPGYVSTHFSSWHPGTDIATGLGMPIHPILSGKVAEVTYGWVGLGHYVVIEHEQGFRSTYGHMGNIYIRKDDPVSPSSIIGQVGMTGHTSGPHTHLEITKNGQYIDPQLVLPPLSNWPTAGGIPPVGQGTNKITPAPTKTESTPTPIMKNFTLEKFTVTPEPKKLVPLLRFPQS